MEDINQLGGYMAKELYVNKKYKDYKTEILHHLTMKQYNNLIINKANEYFNSEAVKNLEANNMDIFHHFGIPIGSSITINHIISIILYCDMDIFSTKFSETFRKIYSHETLQSVKKRNSAYWWQSKLLIETVCIYGIRSAEKHPGYTHNPTGQDGPFFTGVTCVLPIPEFNIRLYSPTSTSKHIEVSIKFASGNGMIITLNNDKFSGKGLRFFDCSWISRYPDEDERLFIHGFLSIRVQSVRIIEQNQTYTKFFDIMFRFDLILNGYLSNNVFGNLKTTATKIDGLLREIGTIPPELSYEQKLTYQELINDGYTDEEAMSAIKLSNESSIDPYIISTFNAYIKTKKAIIVRTGLWDHMVTASNEKQIKLPAFHSMVIENSDMDCYKPAEVQPFMSGGVFPYRQNLLSPKIFKLLPNLKIIMIETSFVSHCYMFNLYYFLENIIMSSTWKQIKITDTTDTSLHEVLDYENRMSWITYLWKLSSVRLKKAYQERNLSIEYRKEVIKTENKRFGEKHTTSKEYLIIQRRVKNIV